MRRIWIPRFGALFAAIALVVAFVPAAFAQSGQSTPGVIVTAENPGTSSRGSDLQISLTAHSELSTVPNPSCRPQDLTLRCNGSLFLRVPERGGMTVTHLQVHRVAVGDISCGDDEGGDCGDEGGGCEDGGSCEGGDVAILAIPSREFPVQAQVNGVAVLTKPGDTGLPVGTPVQVKITLTDNGTAQYADLADVQVNQFVPGPVKPLIYESGPQVIQQVQIHSLDTHH